MLVYQCDADGCGKTSQPRIVRYWPPPPAPGELPSIETPVAQPQPRIRLELPVGWSELQSFLGFDREDLVASELIPIEPNTTVRLELHVNDVFLPSAFALNYRDRVDGLVIRRAKIGRSFCCDHLLPRPAADFEFPKTMSEDIIMTPWMPCDVTIENQGSVTQRVQFLARGLYHSFNGVQIIRSKRYLCPDHTPRLRNTESSVIVEKIQPSAER